MAGHVMRFSCRHCSGDVFHRGDLLGIADCPACGAQYRVDIRIDCLHQARFGTPLAGPRRDLTAAAAGLVDLLITTERSRSHH